LGAAASLVPSSRGGGGEGAHRGSLPGMVGFARRLPFLVLLSLASIRLLRPVSSKPPEATRHSLCKNCAADPAILRSETRQAARDESVCGALRLRCLSLRGGKRESSRKDQAGLSAKSIRESGVKKQSRTGGTVRDAEKKKKKKKKVKEKDPSSNHERDRRTGSKKEKKEKRKEQKEKKQKQGERKTEQKVPKDRDTPNTHDGMRGKSKERSKCRQEDTPEKVIRGAGKPAKNDGDAAPADKFRDRDTPKRLKRRTPQDEVEGDKEYNPADDVSENGTSTGAVPPAFRSSLDQEEEVVPLTEEEKEMMRFANSLSPEQQQAIDGLMRGWVRLNASSVPAPRAGIAHCQCARAARWLRRGRGAGGGGGRLGRGRDGAGGGVGG